MRKVTWESVDEQGGDFKRLPAGGYVVKVTNVEDDEAHERAYLVFDIAEGEYKGFFASDPFFDGKDYAHRLMLSYRDSALGFLKHKLSIISDANMSFDAEEAWNTGKLTLFAGKLIGLAVGTEEYAANNGDTRTRLDWFHAKMMTPEEIRSGHYEIPEPKKLDDGQAPARTQAVDAYADDSNVPF